MNNCKHSLKRIEFEHVQILSTLDNLSNVNLPLNIRINTCESLLHYVSEHFIDEEMLMNEYSDIYSVSYHKLQHEDLQETFLVNIAGFIKNDPKALSNMKSAFENHIQNIDMPLFDIISQQIEND